MNRIQLATAALCAAAFIDGSVLPAQAVPSNVVAKGIAASPGAATARDNTPGAANAPASATKPPAGYVQVHSAPISAAEGQQSSGSVSCPGSKVPLGGGVTIASDDVNDNLNSSYPSGKTWVVEVNNDSFSDTSFTVYAICANKPAGYQLSHSATVTNPANDQTQALAKCSGSKVPWGGGFFSTSGNVAVDANSSYPTGASSHVWNIHMNNGTTTNAAFVAYAVCANKPRLYSQPVTSGTSNPVSEDFVSATCGSGQVTTGGGDYSGSTSVFVDLNSTAPLTSTVWRTWENNNTEDSSVLRGYAVCVGL